MAQPSKSKTPTIPAKDTGQSPSKPEESSPGCVAQALSTSAIDEDSSEDNLPEMRGRQPMPFYVTRPVFVKDVL